MVEGIPELFRWLSERRFWFCKLVSWCQENKTENTPVRIRVSNVWDWKVKRSRLQRRWRGKTKGKRLNKPGRRPGRKESIGTEEAKGLLAGKENIKRGGKVAKFPFLSWAYCVYFGTVLVLFQDVWNVRLPSLMVFLSWCDGSNLHSGILTLTAGCTYI